jgi:mRNA-degrading endonuclease toxin of MazEF toxin-antitoxin module
MACAPERGDIVWLSVDPQAGHRPALALSQRLRSLGWTPNDPSSG